MIKKLFKKWSGKKDQFGVPKWVPESRKSEIAGLRHFLTAIRFFKKFCYRFWAPFWNPLGASWEPSWASWGSLGRPLDPKTCKKQTFFKGYEKAVFWSLKLLMALLGSSCCFLGKSGPKMGFQNGCQKCRGEVSKNELVPFWTSFGAHFGTHVEPQNLSKIC